MREMQFTAIVMLTVYTLALVFLLPNTVRHNAVANHSRKLMAWSLALLGLQFLVQYVFGFRLMGVTRAVVVNLAFFIPVASLMSLSLLNLQRHGRLTTFEKWVGVPTWFMAMLIIGAAVLMDIPYGSKQMAWTEAAASTFYGLLQLFYGWKQFKEVKRISAALDDYYDRDQQGLLLWMKGTTVLLTVLALFAPVFIFTHGLLLLIYGVVFIFGISAMWFCFARYMMSGEMKRVEEAEESEKCSVKCEECATAQLTDQEREYVNQAVDRWLSHGGHLRKNITKPDVVSEIHLSKELLTAWYKANGYDNFKQWLNALRVERAKQLLKENPTWSNETVADQCGISRSRFHSIFKHAVGLSPSEYQEKES